MAVTDVQRGDSAIALRSCAHSPGRKVYCRLKLTISHDPGRIEREIRLWLRDCETEYYLDFRTCLDLSAVVIAQGRNYISWFCGKCGTELFRRSLRRRPLAAYGHRGEHGFVNGTEAASSAAIVSAMAPACSFGA